MNTIDVYWTKEESLEFYSYMKTLEKRHGIDLYPFVDKLKPDNKIANLPTWLDILIMEDEKNAPAWLFNRIAFEEYGLKECSGGNEFEIAFIKLEEILNRSLLVKGFYLDFIENCSSTGYLLNLNHYRSSTETLLKFRINDTDPNCFVYKIEYECTVNNDTTFLTDDKKFVYKNIGEVIDFLDKIYCLMIDPLQVCSDISLMIQKDPITEILKRSKETC